MNIRMLGSEGVLRRMQEIEAKIAAVDSKVEAKDTPAFSNTLNGLTGQIGGNGFAPMNPMAGGIQLNPQNAPSEIKQKIEQAALEANIDPRLLDALVAQESSYDPLARSRAGAMGLTQLMPDTARSLGVSNPFDPDENLRGGAKYLSQMLSKFGDVSLALAAYNAGPGAVAKFNGIPNYAETKNYVAKILAGYEARKGP